MKKKTFLLTTLVGLVLLGACNDETLQPRSPANNTPTEPISDANFGLKVNVSIQVGEYHYSDLPASVKISAWDTQNHLYEQTATLQAGTNLVSLPKKYARIKLSLDKWGIHDERTLTQAEALNTTVVTLGKAKEVQKLSQENIYTIANNQETLETQRTYTYYPNGKLKYIDVSQANKGVLQYMGRHLYQWNGSLLTKVFYFDENQSPVGVTELNYDDAGRVKAISEKRYGQQTLASITYATESSREKVSVHYTFDNNMTMDYTFYRVGTNIVEEYAQGATGTGETGKYNFDSHINPYAVIGVYSLFLTNLSKNNMIASEKGYHGNIPMNVPYQYDYQYNEEGYPTQLLTKFKGYSSNQHLFTQRKELIYE